ncbi:MAG: bacteriocin fulvocin C-related protein [Chitinophagaceae bacterium]|nr:bacteriocin fulvocin C-related protein [Chitinophagaceae bacterium]
MPTKFKSILLLFCLSIYTIVNFSCSKNENSNDGLTDTENKLNSILSLKSKEDRKIAFRFLTEREKTSLWTNYLTRSLNMDIYSAEQKALIREAFTFLTPAFFENDIILTSDLFEVWKFRITTAFSERLKTATFNDLLNMGNFKEIIPEQSQSPSVALLLPPGNCECSTSGDFCGNNNYNIGPFCVVTHKCNTGGCTAKEDGCGWFWSQKCDGKCKETYTGNCPT